ncbi:Dabb family protein [Nocardia inohanensis]|uniref:Dabb family protein n=1 Tax=Nocardia inohanensis TaxID=209246 RepID=UPI000834949D|nr:Dabb family protein [Nocardia inohanensis]
MIVHQLRFRFRDETTDAQKSEILELMRRTTSVDSVAFATVGQHIGAAADDYTHALCVAWEDLTALEKYMHDPVHLAGDPSIIPHLAALAVGPDLSDDPDPDLPAKIMAANQRKIDMYPEWGALMSTIPDLRINIAA